MICSVGELMKLKEVVCECDQEGGLLNVAKGRLAAAMLMYVCGVTSWFDGNVLVLVIL